MESDYKQALSKQEALLVGWQNCDKQLTACQQELQKLSERNTALESEYKTALSKQEELLEGWKKCNDALEELKNTLSGKETYS